MSGPPPPAAPSRRSCLTIGLAGIVFSALLIGLALLVMGVFSSLAPVVVGAVLAGLVFGGMAVHYVIWGRWLSQLTEKEDQDDRPDTKT